MNVLVHFNKCYKAACAWKRTLYCLHFRTNIKVPKVYFNTFYCSQAVLTEKFASEIHEETPSDFLQNEQTACQDDDTFGKLKRSLESVRRDEKKNNFKSKKSEPKSRTLLKKANSLNVKKSNTFGDLSDSQPMWYPDLNEKPQEYTDQSDDSVYVKLTDTKFKCAKSYLTEMKRLVKEKKIKEALELFLAMKRNQVVPVHANYTYMIGVCGRAGYTEMAFKLLRQMTDMGFQPTPATLTGLFNSCAECPFPEYGLKKAKLLKEKIEQKNWVLNQVTYHSIIKAFGKCGDIQMAFQIVDEMAKEEIKIDVMTYSFLLMSCAADKEAGFTHAVEVWRKMKSKRCSPNLFSYNLLLRAVRDCGIGPEEVSCLLLQHWSSYSKRPYGLGINQISSKKEFLKLTSQQGDVSYDREETVDHKEKNTSDTDNEGNTISEQIHESEKSIESFQNKEHSVSKVMNAPSLLLNRPLSGPEYINLVNIVHPSDRLALVGGVNGFLESMKSNKIKPNIKTFTLLLESMPSNAESEEELLSQLDIYDVRPDIDFFNILIKKRNLRKHVGAGRKVLSLINKYALCPDIVTFGVLALGCLNRKQASFLLNDMAKLDVCPNTEIIGALIHNATKAMDFKYMEDVLKLMIENDIKPNEKVLLTLENAVQSARENIINMEHGKDVDIVFQDEYFSEKYKIFCSYYEEWLKNIGIERSVHPWLQYKTEITEKVKQEDYQH